MRMTASEIIRRREAARRKLDPLQHAFFETITKRVLAFLKKQRRVEVKDRAAEYRKEKGL